MSKKLWNCTFADSACAKKRRPLLACLCVGLLGVCGCAQDMMDTPRAESQEHVAIYPDGSADRAVPHRTVVADPSAMASIPVNLGTTHTSSLETAMSSSNANGYHTGRGENGDLVDEIPPQVMERFKYPELLARGRERFNIYCSPCHDRTGSGNGMAPRRGFPYPPSYHTPRLRQQPVGYFFSVATGGHGRMPPYGEIIPTDDRWAIAAYVRTLQFSQYAPETMLSAADRDQLQNPSEQRRGEEETSHE